MPYSPTLQRTRHYPAGLHFDSEIAACFVAGTLDDAVVRWPQRPAINFMGRLFRYSSSVDWRKDMTWCSGFNCHPRTIAEAICVHPAVAERCMIGIPDEYRGLTRQAFPGYRIGKHGMIGAIHTHAKLPGTPVGKLSKLALVDEATGRRMAAAA